MKTTGIIAIILSAAAIFAVGGCGYGTEELYDPSIRFIYVPIAERGKDVYIRDQEIKLTEAVQKRIELDTPYKVVGTKDRADAELKIKLEKIEQGGLSIDPNTGDQNEAKMEFTIQCKLTNLKTHAVKERTIIASEAFTGDRFIGFEKTTGTAAERIVEFLETW